MAMDYCVSAGAGRGMRLTFWVGFSLILLAAGLNLAVVAAAEFAPRALPMEAYAVYEELKSVVTLTLAAMGLALILRAALARPDEEPRYAGPERITPLALRARSGGIQLVTTRYLPTVRVGRSAPAVAAMPAPPVEAVEAVEADEAHEADEADEAHDAA
jgi:hypothetical protein